MSQNLPIILFGVIILTPILFFLFIAYAKKMAKIKKLRDDLTQLGQSEAAIETFIQMIGSPEFKSLGSWKRYWSSSKKSFWRWRLTDPSIKGDKVQLQIWMDDSEGFLSNNKKGSSDIIEYPLANWQQELNKIFGLMKAKRIEFVGRREASKKAEKEKKEREEREKKEKEQRERHEREEREAEERRREEEAQRRYEAERRRQEEEKRRQLQLAAQEYLDRAGGDLGLAILQRIGELNGHTDNDSIFQRLWALNNEAPAPEEIQPAEEDQEEINPYWRAL